MQPRCIITLGLNVQTERDIYIPTDRYLRLVDALANLQPCPIAGRVTEDQYKIVLGEIGGTWPDHIRREVILAGAEQPEENIVRVTFPLHRLSAHDLVIENTKQSDGSPL